MTERDDVLAWFGGLGGPQPGYLLDLTIWYKWTKAHSGLPAEWQDYSLPQIAKALGSPAWLPVRPWRVELPGVEIQRDETSAERVIHYVTAAGTLQERWTCGPDGDWWQEEYPVKTLADLPAARALAAARTYQLLPEEWTSAAGQVGDLGVAVAELPMRPYSDVLHTLLGWGEGLMLLRGEGQALLQDILAILEAKLQGLVTGIAGMQGSPLVLSPDNLDSNYVSPRAFREYLAESYRRTTGVLHAAGKRLVVHAGGPASRLLPLLAEAGVDAVEGICGLPLGDGDLAAARALAGPDLILWGGIGQQVLQEPYDQAAFAAVVADAARQATGDPRAILSVADRVPAGASIERLRALNGLIREDRRG